MARLLDSVVGHKALIDAFIGSWQNGKLGSSFLFVGPAGVGKTLTAKALIQVLLCESKGAVACGKCPSCIRVSSGNSEALFEIGPDKGQIRVESSREVVRRLSLKTSGQAQAVLIREAHLMNPQAANALLKMIEEPPEACHFFLIAPGTSSLLATIRSRCQIFRFSPLSVDEIRQIAPDADEWILRASRGSLERLEALRSEEFHELRSLASKILWWGLFDDQSFFELEWRKSLKDRDKNLLLIEVIGSFLRDALVFDQGGTEFLNSDYMDFIKGVASSNRIGLLSQRLPRLDRDMNANVEPQLAFEAFFYREA